MRDDPAVGKGITASSIAVLLKGCGWQVNMIKIDPYLNVDAGTMSPFEHGVHIPSHSAPPSARFVGTASSTPLSPRRLTRSPRHVLQARHSCSTMEERPTLTSVTMSAF